MSVMGRLQVRAMTVSGGEEVRSRFWRVVPSRVTGLPVKTSVAVVILRGPMGGSWKVVAW